MTDTTTPIAPAAAEASPELTTSTQRQAFVAADESTLTVSVQMSKGTEYSKEKKEVGAFLKVSLPEGAIIINEFGEPDVNPAFVEALDSISQRLMGVCELSTARQHGLAVESADDGTVRVLGLFPGASTVPAATVAQGTFSPPAAALAAPVATTAPVAAAAPAAAVPGAFPAPTAPVAPVAGGNQGGAPRSTNPLAWSNQTPEAQQQIANTVEAWISAGGQGAEVVNRMTQGERYPGVTVRMIPGVTAGDVKVSGGTLKNPRGIFGPATKGWAAQCEAQGIAFN